MIAFQSYIHLCLMANNEVVCGAVSVINVSPIWIADLIRFISVLSKPEPGMVSAKNGFLVVVGCSNVQVTVYNDPMFEIDIEFVYLIS